LQIHRLIYDTSQPDNLLAKVHGTDGALPPFLEFNYILGAELHRFRAEVVSCRPMGPAATLAKLKLPERIDILNRRESLRVRPPVTMPITLGLYSRNGGMLSCQARDISSGGVGFSMPEGSIAMESGTQMPVRIHLPGGHTVPATIIIRHLIPDDGMVRVGAEFLSLSSQGRQKISDYVIMATLGPDRFNSAQADQLPLVCVIGDGVETEDLAQLERSYRLIRHDLTGDWKRLVHIEPDGLLFRNLGAIPAQRLIPKVRALPSLSTAPSVLVTDTPDLDTDLDTIMVSTSADAASVIDAMETAITVPSEGQEAPPLAPTETSASAEASTADEGETVLVLNLQRRITLKAICCMKSYKYRLIVLNRQDQVLRYLTEQRPALMLFGAASAKELKPLLDELSAYTSLAGIPRVVLVDPPQRIVLKRLSQPIRLRPQPSCFSGPCLKKNW
jgi:hypothetical protein